MEPHQQIEPPPWMTAPQTGTVMKALNDTGRAPQTLFVGGCVRNALLGKPVADIDLATIHTPPQVMERLQRAGIRHIPTGIDHGTVTALVEGRSFEVTTLRRDVETDGRRAVIAFTADWAEDAGRRDFTMNTLLADEQGHIYDPLGQGLADLRAGRVVFVGDPAARIAEDYLRILRFFRFHAFYGRGAPDPAALRACGESAPHMRRLSRERVTQEMMKILSADDPAPTLALMFSRNIAREFGGDGFDAAYVSEFCRLQRAFDEVDVLARLAVLMDMDAGRIPALMMLSNAQLKFIRTLASLVHEGVDPSARAVRSLVYRHGAPAVKQGLLLSMTREGDTDLYRALFRIADTFSPPKFPLTGQDVMDLGVKPGAELGQLLAAAEHWWHAQDFAPDRSACLRKLETLVQEIRP